MGYEIADIEHLSGSRGGYKNLSVVEFDSELYYNGDSLFFGPEPHGFVGDLLQYFRFSRGVWRPVSGRRYELSQAGLNFWSARSKRK